MAKRQTQIPGTERSTIAKIDDVATRYRSTVDDRMQMQEDEATLKADLMNEIERQIEQGALVLPENYDGSSVAIYKYTDDEGIDRVVYYSTTRNVKVGKAKGAAAESVEEAA